MARKLRELAAPNDDATLMDSVCQSAHQIWQAGLGAFATAQGQGEALFGKLLERGASVQKRIEDSTGHASAVVEHYLAEADAASAQAGARQGEHHA